MKRLKILSCLFVLQVLLVIPALQIEGVTPVSPEVQTNDIKKNSPIESIIKKVREYRKVEKFEEALQELNKALEKFPQKEYRKKLKIERADLHYWWALSLKKKYDYANAIRHLEMAYAIDKIYRPKDVANELLGIGFLYSALGQKQKALEYYEKALAISQAVGDHKEEAATLNNIGKVYSALGQKHKALEYFEKALLIRKAVGDRCGEAITLSNLMFCWESLKNTQLSIFYGKQSVNAFQNLRANISKLDRMIKKSYLEIQEDTYRFLAGLLIGEGRLSEAQHVLDMLKEIEYIEFTSKYNSSTTSTYSQLDFTGFEKQWLEKYKKVTKDYSAISGDYYLLKKKKIKSDVEKKRMKELEASLILIFFKISRPPRSSLSMKYVEINKINFWICRKKRKEGWQCLMTEKAKVSGIKAGT